MKKSEIIILAVAAIVLVGAIVSIGLISRGGSNSNGFSQEVKQSINTTQEWVSFISSNSNVKVIDDGFLSIPKEKAVDIALDLTKTISQYALMDSYLLDEKMKNECKAQLYIINGILLHEDLFTKTQINRIENMDKVQAVYSIEAATNALGKDKVTLLTGEYAHFIRDGK